MATNTTSPRVGFIGLGTMGSSMAANWFGRASTVTVWNRPPDATVVSEHGRPRCSDTRRRRHLE